VRTPDAYSLQDDQETSKSAVAVVEGVERLELAVTHRGSHDRIDVIGLHPHDQVA